MDALGAGWRERPAWRRHARAPLFQKKFKDRSGLRWENRANDPILKYMLVERRSEGDDGSEEEDADNLPEDVERMCGVEPECTLETKVRDPMEVTFNEANMRTTMAQLNYNANKRPLGELATSTIKRGFEHLKLPLRS